MHWRERKSNNATGEIDVLAFIVTASQGRNGASEELHYRELPDFRIMRVGHVSGWTCGGDNDTVRALGTRHHTAESRSSDPTVVMLV